VLRYLVTAVAVVAFAASATAHFVFVLPAKNNATVSVVLSEELAIDEDVGVEKVAGLKLTCRDAVGKETPVELKSGKHALTGPLPGSGPRLLYGTVPYGVMPGKDGKAYLITYHPKTIVGPVAADKLAVGAKLPVELTPNVAGGEVAFVFSAGDKPLAGEEVTVIKPNGEKAKVKTDKAGKTIGFPAAGRYGAWAKHVDTASGELCGKKYGETRHYATLVVTYEDSQ
jgi:uncharacterized GH25 family protein